MVKRVIKYLEYLFKSRVWGHGIHSPFAYDLVKDVIDSKSTFYVFEHIEEQRKKMLSNQTVVELKDYGAGSKINKTTSRTIKSIAKNSLKHKKYAQLLFRLIDHLELRTILELGTSLGITTAYFALSNKKNRIISIEGDEAISQIAKSNFKALGISNIKLKNCTFTEAIEGCLTELKPVDMVFIDGHHTYEATMQYFNQCLPYKQNNSLFVIDDINWSNGMQQAWKEIKRNKEVTLTIDLFELGLVFFRKESTKQDLMVYY